MLQLQLRTLRALQVAQPPWDFDERRVRLGFGGIVVACLYGREVELIVNMCMYAGKGCPKWRGNAQTLSTN